MRRHMINEYLLFVFVSGLQTTLIAVGASVGGLCFLLLLALFGLYRYGLIISIPI